MKLSHLFLFAGSATISYWLTKQRHAIAAEITDTTDSIQAIKENMDTIHRSLEIIEEQKENINNLKKDVMYQVQVLQKDVQARLEMIQKKK